MTEQNLKLANDFIEEQGRYNRILRKTAKSCAANGEGILYIADALNKYDAEDFLSNVLREMDSGDELKITWSDYGENRYCSLRRNSNYLFTCRNSDSDFDFDDKDDIFCARYLWFNFIDEARNYEDPEEFVDLRTTIIPKTVAI